MKGKAKKIMYLVGSVYLALFLIAAIRAVANRVSGGAVGATESNLWGMVLGVASGVSADVGAEDVKLTQLRDM